MANYQKVITYKGKEYRIEIAWGGSTYCVRSVPVFSEQEERDLNLYELMRGNVSIPTDCLDDIEKIKPYIIQAIEYKSNLYEIEIWDGVI
jgi:hypothetical protein